MKQLATIIISTFFLLGLVPVDEFISSGTSCMAFEVQEAYYDIPSQSVQMKTTCGAICNDDTIYEMDCDSDFITDATEVITN